MISQKKLSKRRGNYIYIKRIHIRLRRVLPSPSYKYKKPITEIKRTRSLNGGPYFLHQCTLLILLRFKLIQIEYCSIVILATYHLVLYYLYILYNHVISANFCFLLENFQFSTMKLISCFPKIYVYII